MGKISFKENNKNYKNQKKKQKNQQENEKELLCTHTYMYPLLHIVCFHKNKIKILIS